ncbi:MAG: hypothetical protein OQK25_03800, partial [Gammaproteobacteria bacterium]|nr:hypothetical protein [Gammaproteobacteria bacterium]
GCCTARVLFDFGGTDAAMYRASEVSSDQLQKEYDAVMEEHCVFKETDHDGCIDGPVGNAVIVATTTTDQKVANEFLKEKGFLCVGPYSKPKHEESGLYLWWLPIYGMYGEQG